MAIAVFQIVRGNEGVFQTLYLPSRFVLPSDFYGMNPIQEEVSPIRERHFMAIGDLVGQKGFPRVPLIHAGALEQVHQIGVVQEELFRLLKDADAATGLEKSPNQLGFLEVAQIRQQGLPVKADTFAQLYDVLDGLSPLGIAMNLVKEQVRPSPLEKQVGKPDKAMD